MSNTFFEKAMAMISGSADAVLKASALQAAGPIVQALQACDEELRAEALNLFDQLNSGKLDEGERHATLALLAEILFPNTDDKGFPGVDLEEAEGIAETIPSAAAGA